MGSQMLNELGVERIVEKVSMEQHKHRELSFFAWSCNKQRFRRRQQRRRRKGSSTTPDRFRVKVQ